MAVRWSNIQPNVCGYCGATLKQHNVTNHMNIWHKNRQEIEDAELLKMPAIDTSGGKNALH